MSAARSIIHGTPSAYTYHACRCDICRQTATTRRMEHKQRIRAEGRQPAVHNAATYTNFGCRCTTCTAANTDYQREHRQRRAGAR